MGHEVVADDILTRAGDDGAGATTPAPQPHRPTERRRPPFTTERGLTILGFLAPGILVVAVFTYYPMIRGAQMAFRDWNLFDLTSTPWVGFGNFRTIFADPNWGTIVSNTVIWVIGSLVPQLVIGFGLALLLRRRFRFRGTYQALVFFPWAVSGFLIGILFRWMFNGEFGVINDLLLKAGLIDANLPWLADPELARVSVIIANVWYGVTFFTIMILAALQSVPDEAVEAAALDGAGKVRTLWSVIIPYIRTTLALTILLRVIWIFNFPDIIYAMTNGGPASQTHIVTTYMITLTQQGSYGQASALGLLVVGVLGAFAAFYLLATKEGARS
ncbi:carbohydrate ABC transporter permease [Knoellia sp. CPCC 206453]|uniref:carbohydrate ABC transporter permease n=1 Tax=Knoellia pratensis TaxID=3404796 RepID=UPI00361D548F